MVELIVNHSYLQIAPSLWMCVHELRLDMDYGYLLIFNPFSRFVFHVDTPYRPTCSGTASTASWEVSVFPLRYRVLCGTWIFEKRAKDYARRSKRECSTNWKRSHLGKIFVLIIRRPHSGAFCDCLLYLDHRWRCLTDQIVQSVFWLALRGFDLQKLVLVVALAFSPLTDPVRNICTIEILSATG